MFVRNDVAEDQPSKDRASEEMVLSRITALLNQPVPQHYLDCLARFPDSLRTARRSIDDSDVEGVVADVEFQTDLSVVLDLNLEVREDSVPDADGVEHLWPDQFLVVGESGDGDYYCLDVLGEIQGVLHYNHQAVQFTQFAESLTEFVEILEDIFLSDGEDDEECDDEDNF